MAEGPDENTLVGYVRRLETMPNNQFHGKLRERVVAVLENGHSDLPEAVVELGAKICYAVGNPPRSSNDPRIVPVALDPLGAGVPAVDVAFFDARTYEGFDHVSGVADLVAQMKRVLRPDGALFCILKSGAVNHSFDVYNSIVRSAKEVLPSQDYLFRELLGDCTIRMLEWIQTGQRYETVRFFRLSLKRPTLLFVLGRSHSGKTSLARDFQALDSHMHVSNDYIYCEIVEKHKAGQAAGFPQQLVSLAGDGSGKACGAFNRALENDLEMLKVYIEWLIPLLPRHKRLISMDLDLVKDEQVELAKTLFTKAGFSVWVVQR
jgi:SAM-dependent methyltransferase